MPAPLLLMGAYRPDADGGREPDIPTSVTRWGQATDVLDTAPVNGRPSRFLIVAEQYNAGHLSAWRQQAGNRLVALPRNLEQHRRRWREGDRTSRAVWRRAVRRATRVEVNRRRALDVAPALLPFLATLGLAEAMRRLGVEDAIRFAALSPLSGTSTILDTWATGADGAIEGDSPETGSGTYAAMNQTDVAPELRRATSTGTVNQAGGNATNFVRLSGAGLDDDQFCIASMTADRFRAGPLVRCGNVVSTTGAGEFDAYICYTATNNLYIKRQSGTVLTSLASGSDPTVAFIAELAVVGSDLEAFLDGVSDITATDTSHTSGDPGLVSANSRKLDDWEAGSIGGGGGGGGELGGALRGGWTNSLARIRRGWSGR